MRENSSSISPEIRSNISKVVIEKELPYGIYLPDWESVVKAVHVFSAGDFQMAPLTKEEVEKEQALRKVEDSDPLTYSHHLDSELKILRDLHSQKPAEPEEVDRVLGLAKGEFQKSKRVILYSNQSTMLSDTYDNSQCSVYSFQGGYASYGKVLSIESLGEPYMLTMFSKYFEDTGESKLADRLERGRMAFPRKVVVNYEGEEGDVSRIDFDDVAQKLKSSLHTNVSGKDLVESLHPDRKTVSTDLYPNPASLEKKSISVGIFDGLEVKISPLNAYGRSKEGQIVKYTYNSYYVGIEHRPAALEISIADPNLESRAYGSVNLIPPEKREKAQAVAEKIRDAFKPNF